MNLKQFIRRFIFPNPSFTWGYSALIGPMTQSVVIGRTKTLSTDKSLPFVNQRIAPSFIMTTNNKNDRHSILINTFLDNSGPDLISRTITWVSWRPTAALSAFKSQLPKQHILHAWQNIKATIINNTYRLWFRGASWSKETGHWPIFQGQPFYESRVELVFFLAACFNFSFSLVFVWSCHFSFC